MRRFFFSPSIRHYAKFSRQHDSHGSTLTATAVSSVTVCCIYSSVHWKKDLFTARKVTYLKKFSTTPPEIGKQLVSCERLDDKLLLIKRSPVDLMQLGSKMCFRRKNKIKKTKKTKFRIDSITQHTEVGFTRCTFPSSPRRCFFFFWSNTATWPKATHKNPTQIREELNSFPLNYHNDVV